MRGLLVFVVGLGSWPIGLAEIAARLTGGSDVVGSGSFQDVLCSLRPLGIVAVHGKQDSAFFDQSRSETISSNPKPQPVNLPLGFSSVEAKQRLGELRPMVLQAMWHSNPCKNCAGTSTMRQSEQDFIANQQQTLYKGAATLSPFGHYGDKPSCTAHCFESSH